MESIWINLNAAYVCLIPFISIYNIIADVLYIHTNSTYLAESQFLGLYWLAFAIIPVLAIIITLMQLIKRNSCEDCLGDTAALGLILIYVWFKMSTMSKKQAELDHKKTDSFDLAFYEIFLGIELLKDVICFYIQLVMNNIEGAWTFLQVIIFIGK